MIVVTTPTSNIGHPVVQHLLDAGETVLVITREAGMLPKEARDRVDIVEDRAPRVSLRSPRGLHAFLTGENCA